jgi:hypothetical protein
MNLESFSSQSPDHCSTLITTMKISVAFYFQLDNGTRPVQLSAAMALNLQHYVE